MGTLQRYIGENLFAGFLVALAAFCLAILLGVLIQQIHYYQDFSAEFFAKLLPVVMPFVLFFALPVAMLVALVMVFGRLSAKGELTAMRAHGISLIRTTAPAILLGILLSMTLAYLQWEVIPKARYEKRNLVVRELHTIAKAGLFGRRTIKLKNVMVHYQGLSGDVLLGVDGTETKVEGKYRGAVVRRFMAKEGRLYLVENAARMCFVLSNGTLQYYDVEDRSKPPEVVRFEGTATIDIDISDVLKKRSKTLADLTLSELGFALDLMPPHPSTASVGLTETAYERHEASTEWHKRVATSFAPLVFALIAMPLGMLTRSTSRLVGLGLGCLPVLLIYYPLNTLAETLAANASIHAGLAMWTPTVLLVATGIVLLYEMR
ncbi:MAG: LptF/LptG family permease [Planctomycetota bacterium]|nr:LptF/LptG family permease [Planctomycetota bacterium]